MVVSTKVKVADVVARFAYDLRQDMGETRIPEHGGIRELAHPDQLEQVSLHLGHLDGDAGVQREHLKGTTKTKLVRIYLERLTSDVWAESLQ